MRHSIGSTEFGLTPEETTNSGMSDDRTRLSALSQIIARRYLAILWRFSNRNAQTIMWHSQDETSCILPCLDKCQYGAWLRSYVD
jgi:hypothetical protein